MSMIMRGAEQLREQLEKNRQAMILAAAASVAVSAEEVAGMARALCPVETGALRASITASVSRTETGAIARVTCGKAYGWHVEQGTSRMPARPFMYPAARAYEAIIRQRVAAAVREVLSHGVYPRGGTDRGGAGGD